MTATLLLLLTACGSDDSTGPRDGVAPQIAIAGGRQVTVFRGSSTTAEIVVTRTGGYEGPVAITVTGAAAGVTVRADPEILPASLTTSTITFSATSAAATASVDINVSATGAGVAATSTLFRLLVTTVPVAGLPALGLGSVPDRYTAELWVRGSTAYTSTWGTRNGSGRGNAIKIWNVAGVVPALVDSIIVGNAGTLGDIQVSDDGSLLVAAIEPNPNGGLAVYALDTPRTARLLARTTGGELRYGVHTAEVARVNGTLYAFCAIDPANGVPARLVIVSLANPAQPTPVASLQMGAPFIHDVFVRDGLLFTAEWNDGVGIWDIGGGGTGGTVEAPKRISRASTVGGRVHNLWWYQDPVDNSKQYVFVGEEGPGIIGSQSSGDVHVLDISKLDAPVEVARYRVDGAGTHNFSVDEANGLLYAAFYNGGVRVLDVRGNLGACTAAQRTTDGRCDLTLMGRERTGFAGTGGEYFWGVHWSSSGLFASDMLNGLWRITPAMR